MRAVGVVVLTLLATTLAPLPSWPLRFVTFFGAGSACAQASQSSGSRDVSVMIMIPDEGRPFEYGIDQAERNAILKEFKQPPTLGIYKYESKKEVKRLPAFSIDKYEVTNGQYEKFCKATGHPLTRYAKWPQFNANLQPVVGVGYKDAEAYCTWAGKRLPSEEEWEKAARGTDGRIWPWGNERDNNRFNGKWLGRYASAPVGSFPAGDSPYGVSDMAGNVWELTSGSWPGADDVQGHAMRGGSYLNPLPEVRSTVRWASGNEEKGAEYLGFRCVMDANKAGSTPLKR